MIVKEGTYCNRCDDGEYTYIQTERDKKSGKNIDVYECENCGHQHKQYSQCNKPEVRIFGKRR